MLPIQTAGYIFLLLSGNSLKLSAAKLKNLNACWQAITYLFMYFLTLWHNKTTGEKSKNNITNLTSLQDLYDAFT